MPACPRLALVPGDPAGVGPELCVRLSHREHESDLAVFADPNVLLQAARNLDMALTIKSFGQPCGIGELAVIPCINPDPVAFGHANPVNSAQVIAALRVAGEACLNHEFQGLVTGPVHKAAVNAAGIAYTGTTELLGEQAKVHVVMMLANTAMRVALATTHLSLREVPDAITAESLERTLRILDTAMRRDFAISAPRIGVLGLNPHAGEQGILGREEQEVIIPLLETLRAQGFHLTGPLPADTAFIPERLQQFDAILAMYHDQGLPVLKYAGFDQAVNITLGLPYPRVAVDHGTALELAGKNTASDESLWQAVRLCRRLAMAGSPP